MDEFLDRMADGIAARLSGPMNFRFILQPLVSIALGVRDGIHDAKAGTPPFVVDLLFKKEGKKESAKGAWRKLRIPILVGTVLDAAAQFMIFHHIKVVPALIVGVAVIALPYALARGITNRIVSARMKRKGSAQE